LIIQNKKDNSKEGKEMQNLKCKIVNVKIVNLLYLTFQYSTHSFTNNYTNFDLYHHPPDFQFRLKTKLTTKT